MFAHETFRASLYTDPKTQYPHALHCFRETDHSSASLGLGGRKYRPSAGSACSPSNRFHSLVSIFGRVHIVSIWAHHFSPNSTPCSVWRALNICIHWCDLLSAIWGCHLGHGHCCLNHNCCIDPDKNRASSSRCKSSDYDFCTCRICGYLDSCIRWGFSLGIDYLFMVAFGDRTSALSRELESKVTANRPVGYLALGMRIFMSIASDLYSSRASIDYVRNCFTCGNHLALKTESTA